MVKSVGIRRTFDVFCPVCGEENDVELKGPDMDGRWEGSTDCRMCGSQVTLTDFRSTEEVAELDIDRSDLSDGETIDLDVSVVVESS